MQLRRYEGRTLWLSCTKSRPLTAGSLRLVRTSTLPLDSVELSETVQDEGRKLINHLSIPQQPA
jgi:hypothetical protein